MRLAHLLAATTLAAGSAVVATATPASAHALDVQVVTNSTSCPATYLELARIGAILVCVHATEIPAFTVRTDGSECPTGYAEYSVLDFYRVCIRWGHSLT